MSNPVYRARFVVDDNTAALGLFGHGDQHLRLIEQGLRVRIVPRGNELAISGERGRVEQTLRVLEDLRELLRGRSSLTRQEVLYALDLSGMEQARLSDIEREVIATTAQGRPVSARSMGQREYVRALREASLVFAIGPAGTGKTYLAIALAATSLKRREVGRLILSRPAVEAGEKLGFLPGDLQEKVDPYLRPLYDALFDILGPASFQRYHERGLIEVAPLAYMRGRTLDNAFIILDEAQNTTPEQMKMFLTRLGSGSKMVVTGDLTQVDLPRGQQSGLDRVRHVLWGLEGVRFVQLTDRDVVRNELVQRIVRAYECYEARAAGGLAGNGYPAGGPNGAQR